MCDLMDKFCANRTEVAIRNLVKRFAPRCQWACGNHPARGSGTDVIKWHWVPPAAKMSKLRLSKKRSCQYVGTYATAKTFDWAACRLRVGHCCFTYFKKVPRFDCWWSETCCSICTQCIQPKSKTFWKTARWSKCICAQ